MQPERARPDAYEIEVLEGLAAFARDELASVGAAVLAETRDGLRVRPPRDPRKLLELRLASAVYRRLAFDVPRPKALLGDAHFRRLAAEVRRVARTDRAFAGFRFAAAGADSPTFQRLGRALAEAAGLAFDPDGGALLLRVRKTDPGGGWEVLVRLTPRPLSARGWRVCNRPGGLNATVAVAMNRMAGGGPSARYLNLMCGSGTLLVERFLDGPAGELVGLDLDPEAVRCTRANLEAAGAIDACRVFRADALDAPLRQEGFDVITADLPWGDAVGSHAGNPALHRGVMTSAARMAAPGARLALLTHELRLFREVLAEQDRWRLARELKVAHGGHHPHVFLFESR